MDWPHLIIALVVIVAYVIKHIVATQQESAAQRDRENQKAGPKPTVAGATDDEVARERTALDRRIETAAERRREREETSVEEKPVAAPALKRYIPMSVPTVAIAPAVPRYQPPVRADDSALPAPRSELPRVVRPAPAIAAVKKVPVVAPAGRSKPAVAETPSVSQLPPPAAAKPVAPAVRQALALLKDGRTLTAAFVLKEILDRPVSMRRRWG
jgi:hypothetical protein